jgi:chemotaxis signal transduction protein
MNDTARFVTFSLGAECYALDSSQVKELVMPSRVYSFPHTEQALEGVLVRNGTVIPVCDLRTAFGSGAERNLYLIARCNYAGRAETVAIPVSGECKLVQGERSDAPENMTFVAGLLHTAGKTVSLLDLDRIVAHCIQSGEALAGEAKG